MAVSPRRSSRARVSQPTSATQQSTNSSASSVASSRVDLSGRSQNKLPSPRSSAPARSPSRDNVEEAGKIQPRRTRSSQDNAKEEPSLKLDDELDDDGEEEEITRCICGSLEYPGLPVITHDSSKSTNKGDPNSSALSEDSTSWFIQCDSCKVWQHGGCVGIMDESTSPEEYFCEQCRKDLHRVSTDLDGRKYSLYLPAQEKHTPLSSPEPKNKNSSRSARDNRSSRVNAESYSKGRRATMNSRDSAYDEAEQLRRAIEESKRESAAANVSNVRKGKRSRSESEEHEEEAKRRRTDSGSSSSRSKNHHQEGDSEEEVEKDDKSKIIRGAAARNQKAKQEREKAPARDTERIEKAGKRKGRSEKLRGDDSDPSPGPPSRTMSSKSGVFEKAPAPLPAPETPAIKVSHHKKTGRPPTRRGRVGRNQYTKDRDPPAADTAARTSPIQSTSQDEGGPVNGVSTRDGHQDSSGVGRPSRPRHMNPNRTTLNDMKRRVAGILEFISHTQVEMAGLDPSTTTTTMMTTTSTATKSSIGATHSPLNGIRSDIVKSAQAPILKDLDNVDEETFATLSSVEMMEVLTRRLMRWQGEYGKWGEK